MLVFQPPTCTNVVISQRCCKGATYFAVFMCLWLIFIFNRSYLSSSDCKDVSTRMMNGFHYEILFTVIKWEQIVFSSANRNGDKQNFYVIFLAKKIISFNLKSKFHFSEITITFLIKSFLTRIHLSTYIIPQAFISTLVYICKFMCFTVEGAKLRRRKTMNFNSNDNSRN